MPAPSDRWTSIGLAALALGMAAVVISRVDPTQDDGGYYFQIARHLAAGHGSTFDGLHPTNGYHPLWLLVLVPLFAAAPSREAAAHAAVWLQAALLAAATALAFLAARRFIDPLPSAAAALVFLLLAFRPALGGLEMSLQALCVVACVLAVERWRGEGGSALAAGILLALAFLARLDNLLLAAVVGGVRSLGSARRADGGRGAWLALMLPTLVAALAYAAVNVWLFGHAMPVSAAAKRLWSAHLLAQDPVYQAHGFLAAKAARALGLLTHVGNPLGLVLVAGSVGALALTLGPRWQPLRPYALFATLQLLACAVLLHGELSFARWYFVVPLLLSGLLVGAAAQAWGGRVPAGALALALGAIGLVQAWRWRSREADGGPTAPLHEAARWMAARLAPDARVGAWTAGTVGFESGRTVVNLDGLANTYPYLERDQYDQCHYWRRVGLTHLVDAFAEDGDPPRPRVVPVALPMARYYAPCADRLERVWEGSGAPGASWRIRAYRITWP